MRKNPLDYYVSLNIVTGFANIKNHTQKQQETNKQTTTAVTTLAALYMNSMQSLYATDTLVVEH